MARQKTDRRKTLLGTRIKELRAERGLSQEALAEAIGANVTYVSSVERARENPTVDFLMKLADGLDVDLVDLFNFSWVGMEDRDLKKKLKKLVDSSESETLREFLAMMAARQL